MNQHMGAGIAIGIGVGVALGVAMGNVGAGIAIGIAVVDRAPTSVLVVAAVAVIVDAITGRVIAADRDAGHRVGGDHGDTDGVAADSCAGASRD